jgi:hypothetical protein
MLQQPKQKKASIGLQRLFFLTLRNADLNPYVPSFWGGFQLLSPHQSDFITEAKITMATRSYCLSNCDQEFALSDIRT